MSRKAQKVKYLRSGNVSRFEFVAARLPRHVAAQSRLHFEGPFKRYLEAIASWAFRFFICAIWSSA